MIGKILVVDDDESVRGVLVDILRLEGCTVDSASNGERAVEKIKANTYDLLILDIRMPGMNGIEVMRAVEEIAPNLHVILMTANPEVDTAIEALRLHARDYLVKPVAPKDLIASVSRVLQQASQGLGSGGALEGVEQDVYTIRDGVVFDFTKRMVRWNDQVVTLTPLEANLLKVFADHPGNVLTPGDLISAAHGYPIVEKGAPELLRPLLSRLRTKLMPIPGSDDWIINVRGNGYLYERRSPRG